ncbi:hypothetical protein BY996DRAFT_6412947 [Phakopsora pachyrhizi]|nr:hypothetical protein BY996DRAFT_6412947 [Phakopsora pachyrhizi]
MNTSVIKPSRLLLLGLTDLTRWNLDSSSEGQVIWTYNSSPGRELGEQTFETKYWLSSHPKGPALPDPQGNPLKAAQNGFEFYKKLHSPDCHWSAMVQVFKIVAGASLEGVVSYSNPHQRASVPDHDYEGRLGYWTVAPTESRGLGREVHLVGINIELEKVVVFQVEQCIPLQSHEDLIIFIEFNLIPENAKHPAVVTPETLTLKKATYEVLVLNSLLSAIQAINTKFAELDIHSNGQ